MDDEMWPDEEGCMAITQKKFLQDDDEDDMKMRSR